MLDSIIRIVIMIISFIIGRLIFSKLNSKFQLKMWIWNKFKVKRKTPRHLISTSLCLFAGLVLFILIGSIWSMIFGNDNDKMWNNFHYIADGILGFFLGAWLILTP